MQKKGLKMNLLVAASAVVTDGGAVKAAKLKGPSAKCMKRCVLNVV